MTMEEVASEENLREAFEEVAKNDGAPARRPEHRASARAAGRRGGLASSRPGERKYRPGRIRRVMIPSGRRRAGPRIPDVVDRVVQQAVHRCSARIRPTFYESSHGFDRDAAVTRPSPRPRVLAEDTVGGRPRLEKFFDAFTTKGWWRAGDEGQGPTAHRSHLGDAEGQGGDARRVVVTRRKGTARRPLRRCQQYRAGRARPRAARAGTASCATRTTAISTSQRAAGQRVMDSVVRFIEGRLP